MRTGSLGASSDSGCEWTDDWTGEIEQGPIRGGASSVGLTKRPLEQKSNCSIECVSFTWKMERNARSLDVIGRFPSCTVWISLLRCASLHARRVHRFFDESYLTLVYSDRRSLADLKSSPLGL